MASNAAEYLLPNKDIRINTARKFTQSKTIDKLKDILLTVNSMKVTPLQDPQVLAQLKLEDVWIVRLKTIILKQLLRFSMCI